MTQRRRQDLLVLVGLALAGFVVALIVHATVMPHTTGNADEVVYRYQAEMYRNGMVTTPDAGSVFRPWMSGVIDGERIMVFPPGWPAVLAAGLLVLGSTTVGAAAVMALLAPAAWWFVLELTRDRRTAAVGGVALLASPLVLVHSGTLLSYLPALTCELVVVASLLRAVRTGSNRVLLVGGLAFGMLVSMRPLDAALLAVPLGVYGVWRWRATPSRIARAAGVGLLGAALPVALTLLYNARVTGNPLTFPLEAAGGNNAFGFGPRNVAVGTPSVEVTFTGQLSAAGRNLLELPQWLPGAWLGVPLVLLGVWVLWRTKRAETLMLAGLAVVFPVAYLFYWGSLLVVWGRHHLGPFYYAVLWIPATACVAVALTWLWDRRPADARATLLTVSAAVAGVVVVTGVVLRGPVATFDAYTERAEAQLDVVEPLPDDALVVLPVAFDGPWILFPWNQYANDPELEQGVLYAADAGESVLAALGRFPQRPAFGLLAPDGPGNAGGLTLEPLRLLSGDGFVVTTRLPAVPAGPARAYLATGTGGVQCAVGTSEAGTVVRWTVTSDGVRAEGCAGPVEVAPPTPAGQRPCATGVQLGEGDAFTIREERFWCRTPSASSASGTWVVPGEPRRAHPGPRGLVWDPLSRAEADADLVVSVDALTADAPAVTVPTSPAGRTS